MEERLSTATGTVPRVASRPVRDRITTFLRRRWRAGLRRASQSVGQAAVTALAAVGAFWFAQAVLGHAEPLFAATALLVALGFTRGPRMRRVIEVSVGCTLGILIGDLLMLTLGRGMWQAVVVLFVSLMIARFLDPGAIFTTQMSLQSVLVVLLPSSADGPFSRSADAVVGVCFALLVTFLTPHDTRRGALHGLRSLYSPMVSVLRDLSTALRENESRTAWMALVSSRGTQAVIDDLRGELKQSREVTRYSPIERRRREYIRDVGTAVDRSDLAVRSLRIVARRVVSLIDHARLDDDATERLAAWFDEAADAVEVLHRSLGEPGAAGRHQALAGARDALGAAAARLDPARLGGGSVHGEALIMLLRPMIVDLMEATGARHEDAVACLPAL